MQNLIKIRGKEYPVNTPSDIILGQLSLLFGKPLETEESIKKLDFPIKVIVPDLLIPGHLLNSDELILLQAVASINLMESTIERIQEMIKSSDNKELVANARNKIEELKRTLKKIGGNIYDVQLEVLVNALADETPKGGESNIANVSTSGTIDISAVSVESPTAEEIKKLQQQLASLQSQVKPEGQKASAA